MLSGDIQINKHLIGSWRARWLYTYSDGWACYDVNAAYTDETGYHRVADFQVEHKRDDGALVLAAKVLAELPNHLRAPLLSER